MPSYFKAVTFSCKIVEAKVYVQNWFKNKKNENDKIIKFYSLRKDGHDNTTKQI